MIREMRFNRLTRSLAACLAFAVAAQMSQAAALPPAQQQEQPTQQQQQQTPPAQQQAAQPQQTAQESSSLAEAQMAALPQAPDPALQQQPDAQQQSPAQNPLGTAAGPTTHPTGVAGTRPAGAAIAPAKQKRVRALFIRTGVIIAGCAAAGTVVALSKASPSRPQ